MRLFIRSQHSVLYFSFLVSSGKDSERNDAFRPFREAFVLRAWKKLESLVLRVVPEEDFLHTKINDKHIYVDYGATEDTPENAWILKV